MIIVPTSSADFASYERIEATVGKVFDGDGFLGVVRNPSSRPQLQIPFRLAFIDAPEIGQPYGQESKEFLRHLLVGKSPQLVLICKQSNGNLPIDPYKRVLCMAFVEDQIAPGEISYYWQGQCMSGTARRSRSVIRNVELEMIVNGWAWVLEHYAFEYEHAYFAAQHDAQANRRGLWVANNPEPPWKFKERAKRRRLRHENQSRLI